MRSWVMGRLPSAAARWSGVRASRGETQEFTWIAISVTACQNATIFTCIIDSASQSQTSDMDYELWLTTSSREEWASARDTSAMSHLGYKKFKRGTSSPVSLKIPAYSTYIIWTNLHIASTSACADEWGAGRVASHSFLSYLQKWEIIETTCKSRKLFLLADSHLALMKRSFSSLGVSGPGFLSPGCNLQWKAHVLFNCQKSQC